MAVRAQLEIFQGLPFSWTREELRRDDKVQIHCIAPIDTVGVFDEVEVVDTG